MKRLLVMRHAKSDWEAGAADHARPLNDRGRRSAEAMGRLLTDIGEVPEHAIASTAMRARTTLLLAAAAGEWDLHAEETDDLYETDAEGALGVAADAPEVASLLLVGHEPTSSSLVRRITGGLVAMKTATVVGIDLDVDAWTAIGGARGTIAYVLQSRHFLDD